MMVECISSTSGADSFRNATQPGSLLASARTCARWLRSLYPQMWHTSFLSPEEQQALAEQQGAAQNGAVDEQGPRETPQGDA